MNDTWPRNADGSRKRYGALSPEERERETLKSVQRVRGALIADALLAAGRAPMRAALPANGEPK